VETRGELIPRAEHLATRRQSRGVAGERIRIALNNQPKAVPQALTPAPLEGNSVSEAVSSLLRRDA
jgi:hypothetical protein